MSYRQDTDDLSWTDISVILLGILGASAWGLVVFYATNAERLASSVVRQVTFQLRNSADVAGALGDHVKLETNWWSES